MPVTFAVSQVDPATSAPVLCPLGAAPDAHAGFRSAVAVAGPSHVVSGPNVNPLVLAAHVAFAEHRPLVLAPDDVWFVVLQAVARHVAVHAEQLRARFVDHAGARAIELERDDLHPARDPCGDWSTVPAQLAAQVLAQAGPAARALRATFSTTGPTARVALDVALLDAMQSYFSYSVSSLCGIPSVSLLGEPADWDQVARRADALERIGLDAWLGPLRVVLSEFARASAGRADRDFWRAMYKPEHASGGERVTGWINVLFPYLRAASTPRDVAVHLPAAGSGAGSATRDAADADLDEMAPKPDELPAGLARAPFAWRLPFGEVREMELLAGHVGVAYDPSSGAVRPAFGWCVAPAAPPRAFQIHNASRAGCHAAPVASGALTSLASIARELAGQSAVDLSLGWCPALTSLDGLEALTSLRSLSVTECPGLTTLAPLAGLPALREVSVAQCANVRDLSALASLAALESVTVMHCPAARDVTAIKDLPNLARVVLWGVPTIPPEYRRNLTQREDILALQAWLRANG